MIGNNFVFIHINKTGGSSVERALIRYGKKKGVSFLQFEKKVGFYHAQHFTVRDYIKILGSAYRDKFSCSIVRNPWDRMLSYFAYSYRGKVSISKEEFSNYINSVYVDKDKERLEYIDRCSGRKPGVCIGHSRMIKPCSHWLEGGVDFIGRYETLQRDYEIICDRIKVPKRVLSHAKRSRNKNEDYRYYYTDKAAGIIKDEFAADINNYNYMFD